MSTGQAFSYSFMNDDFNRIYDSEQRIGRIVISFSAFAIFIACLGLFGLVTYAAEQRTREIGVRKVLGASVSNIVGMLSTDFLKLVLLAALIAFPFAWWAMHKWLQDFAYRITISWWIFLAAGLLAIVIALATICFQAIKAALMNPVKKPADGITGLNYTIHTKNTRNHVTYWRGPRLDKNIPNPAAHA